MRLLLLLTCFLLSLPLFSQKSYDSTKLNVCARNIISGIVNDPGHTTDQSRFWNDFDLLKKQVSTVELLEMVNHPNALIRVKAFNFLLDLAYPKFVDILEEHIYDTAEVSLQSGCIITTLPVIQAMLFSISTNNAWIGALEFTQADMDRVARISDRAFGRKQNCGSTTNKKFTFEE